jgi:hypothetical protein
LPISNWSKGATHPLKGGLIVPKDDQFRDAWQAAHNGQAALPTAFDAYLATGHSEPTGAEIVTMANNGVQELVLQPHLLW